MSRFAVAAALACVLAGTARAQPRPPSQRRLLDAPVFTIRPQGALSAFMGEGANIAVAWRPVGDAKRYRVTLTGADNKPTDVEVTGLRFEKRNLPPGRYHLTVAAVDATGTEGALSEPLPLNVVEVRAVPPGGVGPMPPMRGAYAVGTKFSVRQMHCEISEAPIDDLLVLPENELRIDKPGVVTLRCAGIPGYLEKRVIIAPIKVAVGSTEVRRGQTTTVHVTFGSVAFIGPRIDVNAFGDVTVGDASRTDFGIDIPVSAPDAAKTGALSIHAGGFELGRIDLALADPYVPPPEPPAAKRGTLAIDFGGQVGAFVPPGGVMDAPRIGKPSAPGDAVTAGPLLGARLGVFPTPRVGVEGELAIGVGGYAEGSGISSLLAARAQVAVRALEIHHFGVRLFAGAGSWTTLRERGTSQETTDGEIHAGAALTVETGTNLWLRFQLADLVTTARDGGYAHVLEAQLGIFARFGRRDSF